MTDKSTQYDRRTVLKALGAAAATSALTGTAAGQENNTTNTSDTPDAGEAAGAAADELLDETDTGPNAQQLSQTVAVRQAFYLEEDGDAIVDFVTETPTTVTLTDAGGVWTPGRINQVTRTLPSGESRVRIGVTEVSGGRVGVTIAIPSGLFAVPIRSDNSLFGGQASWAEVRWGFGAGLTSGVGAAALVARQKLKSGRKSVERIL